MQLEKIYNAIRYTLGYVFVLSSFSLLAQGTSDDLNNTVIVNKEAKVSIKDADKPQFIPQIIEKETPTIPVEYTTEDRFVRVDYTPTFLKAQGLKAEAPRIAQNSYLKIGFGSLLMPFAELNYNDIVKKNFTYGLKYKFFMAQGKLENQKMNQHVASLYADYVAHKNVKIGFDAAYDRNTHHFYGYNLIPDSNEYEAADIRQVINHFNGKIYIKNPTPNKSKINYLQDVGFDYMFARNGNTEYAIIGHTRLEKQFLKKHFLHLHFRFDYNQLHYPSFTDSIKRTIFFTGLNYTFDDDNWQLKGGLSLGFDNAVTYLFPDIYVEKRLFKHYIAVYGEWSGDIQKNTYYSLVNQNPFIHNIVDIKNTNVENRIAGIKGTIQHFDYDIRFTNKAIRRMPLFVNDPADMKRFQVIYDPMVQVINLQSELAYSPLQNVKLTFTGNYYMYNLNTESHAWHMPSLTGNLRTSYFWNQKLYTYIDIFGVHGAYARAADGSPTRIKGAVDINLGAEYRVHKYIGVFLDAKNIAHMKYQNWYLYPQFGANVMLGVRLRY